MRRCTLALALLCMSATVDALDARYIDYRWEYDTSYTLQQGEIMDDALRNALDKARREFLEAVVREQRSDAFEQIPALEQHAAALIDELVRESPGFMNSHIARACIHDDEISLTGSFNTTESRVVDEFTIRLVQHPLFETMIPVAEDESATWCPSRPVFDRNERTSDLNIYRLRRTLESLEPLKSRMATHLEKHGEEATDLAGLGEDKAELIDSDGFSDMEIDGNGTLWVYLDNTFGNCKFISLGIMVDDYQRSGRLKWQCNHNLASVNSALSRKLGCFRKHRQLRYAPAYQSRQGNPAHIPQL